MSKKIDYFNKAKEIFTFIAKNIKAIVIIIFLLLCGVFILTLPDKKKYLKLFFDQLNTIKGVFKKQDAIVEDFSTGNSTAIKEATEKIKNEKKIKAEKTSVDIDSEIKNQYEKFKTGK